VDPGALCRRDEKLSHQPSAQGNVQADYNFVYHKNGLYPTKFNLRFGFEFNLNKKRLKFTAAQNDFGYCGRDLDFGFSICVMVSLSRVFF